MNRLFKCSSSASSSMANLSELSDIVNQEEHEYQDLDTCLGDRNIPKIPVKEIYKSSFLNNTFCTDQIAKTAEHVFAITKHEERCSLLSQQSVKHHLERGYNYIHVGLIQVAIKPLTRQGLNSSILLSLRDSRFTVYSDSLLGLMESSLHNGPVYFNCYPDLPLSLKDKNILKALTLNIQTAGAITQMLEGSQPIALIYRLYYKCMKTNLNIHALVKSPKDKTVLIQSSTNANIQVPKTISWNDIQLPVSWLSENESFPQKL